MVDTDWKAEYEWAVARIDEALDIVALLVLASGWHPFQGVGFDLYETLIEALRATREPVTQEVVWLLAEANGYQPDFTPLFLPQPEEEA